MAFQIGTSLGYGNLQEFTSYLNPNRIYGVDEVYVTITGTEVVINGKHYSNVGYFNSIFTPMYGVANAQKIYADKFLEYYQNGINLNFEKYAGITNPSPNFHVVLYSKQEKSTLLLLAQETSSNSVPLYSAYTTDRKIKSTYTQNEIEKMIFPRRFSIETKYYNLTRLHSFLPIHCKMGPGELSGTNWYGFVIVSVIPEPNNYTYYFTVSASFITDQTNVFGYFSDVREFDEEYGTMSGSGGYGGGSFDDSSDAFGLPSLPSLGVSEVGFINVYNPSKGQLQGFADELFPNFEMPTPSTATGIEAVAENLANTFEVLGDFAESYVNAGLINYVIDCHIVPVSPVTNGTSNIKVGFKTFNYSPAKVTSDYVAFDCGSLEIAEYYQNFLDYEGTKAKLYLPFIGFVDIKPEWFQSGKLGVTYHFNIIDGSCIAFVIATSSKSKLKNTVVATFGGNCCVHMPITGVNYSSMISGVVGGAVGIASNASNMIKTNRADKGTVMSNIEGATGIASNLADAVGAKTSIEQSNGYNAGMSFMCYRRPYLLIERPVASFSKDYPREQGLPLNVTKNLRSMKGFTTCTAPVVDNFHCLEEEKEMIKQALIEGTIF